MISRLKASSETLTFRIAALLALALMPIGMISVYQTYQLFEEVDQRERANLLALTVEAADREISYIRNAFGVAAAVAAIAPALDQQGDECPARLSKVVEADPEVVFVGYVDAAGRLACASEAQGQDLSQTVLYAQMSGRPVQTVNVQMHSTVLDMAVINVTHPVFEEDRFAGYVVVSLRHDLMRPRLRQPVANFPLNLITFNADGELLTTDHSGADIYGILPADQVLKDLVEVRRMAFRGMTLGGEQRTFAVVPVIGDTVFALSSWRHKDDSVDRLNITSSVMFPVAMWLAGLGVAFFSVQTMVIRPTRNLRARMLMFMRNRRIMSYDPAERPAIELVEIDETWQRMAEGVLHDEAELHDSIHEKTVLLKEVHHRVKNNLQLIASILNMKIRKARSDEEKDTLRDMQQRVMSIARVHQKLYETSSEERVRADELIRSILQQMLASGLAGPGALDLDERYDPVVLYPDQAVPLSLAVSELFTNALKHMGNAEGQENRLQVRLAQEDGQAARLTVRNSVAPKSDQGIVGDSGGLGEKLIRAFVQQIEGTLEETPGETSYEVRVRFPIADFDESAL